MVNKQAHVKTTTKVNLVQQLINKLNEGNEVEVEVFTPFSSSTLEVESSELCVEVTSEEYTNAAGTAYVPGVNIMYNQFYILTAPITNGFKITVQGEQYEITYKNCTICFTF